MRLQKSGFTLVEVIVASTIGAFIALVAVGTLRVISTSAEMLDNNIDVAAEVRFASKIIAADLMNLYRDSSLENTKLVGTVGQTTQGSISCLTLYTVGRTKARVDQPEGDVYEVEYYIIRDEEKSVLCRRLWPNPDKDTPPGGILSVIAENVDDFQVRYFDGQEWQNEWPEEMQSLPELVEVSIQAERRNRADVATEFFIVNFPRFESEQTSALEQGQETESAVESETVQPPGSRRE